MARITTLLAAGLAGLRVETPPTTTIRTVACHKGEVHLPYIRTIGTQVSWAAKREQAFGFASAEDARVKIAAAGLNPDDFIYTPITVHLAGHEHTRREYVADSRL